MHFIRIFQAKNKIYIILWLTYVFSGNRHNGDLLRPRSIFPFLRNFSKERGGEPPRRIGVFDECTLERIKKKYSHQATKPQRLEVLPRDFPAFFVTLGVFEGFVAKELHGYSFN